MRRAKRFRQMLRSIARKNVHFAGNGSPRGMLESRGLMAGYVDSTSTFESIGRTVRSLLPWVTRTR
jgi:capsid portal protein